MFKFNSVNFSKEANIFKKIGLPILGSQLVMYAMTTTDYIMAGYYSANDLAGVGLGASIFNPLYFLTAGVMFGIAPIIAQHFGAKEFDQIKLKTRKFLWVSLVIGAIFSFLLFNAGIIINLLGTEENISRVSLGYLKAVAFGAIPITLYQALRNYSEGITQTKIVFIIGTLGFLLNIPLNYIFIFHFGFGGIGCGIATSIISFLGLGTMWLATIVLKQYKQAFIYGEFVLPDIKSAIELIRIGGPISFGIFVELSMFSGAALVISLFGATSLAAHTIAINIVGLLFMLPLSLGLASAIRVGNLIGEKSFSKANYAANFSLRLSFFVAILNFILIIVGGEFLISLYTTELPVIAKAIGLLMLAAIFQVPDAIGFSAIGSLRGHKDTFATMVNLIISYWFFALPIGIFLAFSNYAGVPNEAEGIWIGMIIGIAISAILNALRLKYKKKLLKKLY
tara:strand:- start:6651 stop:8006 length:1356 start_codon:yes stop_codon:yes gene_type:complete